MKKSDIITYQEILEIYGLGQRTTRRYLNMKSCPVLPRKKGQPYRVIKSKFEEWLMSQTR